MRCASSSSFVVSGAAIPLVLRGRDVLAKAKTGSGKTLVRRLQLKSHP